MRALVAMSGGVDSSVAAALMLEQGYEVVGVTLKQWEGVDGQMPLAGCCTVSDSEDARRVAAQLDIPYYVLDYVDEFTEKVVDHFGEMYAAGKTPNPCIECNRRVRFSVLLDRTAALGCDVLVTGHHARIRHDDDGYHLIKAVVPDEGPAPQTEPTAGRRLLCRPCRAGMDGPAAERHRRRPGRAARDSRRDRAGDE